MIRGNLDEPIVRFWLTSNYNTGEITAIRGQCGETDDDPLLYEITQKDGTWYCHIWLHLQTDPDAHAFREVIKAPDCFKCMLAAEMDARAQSERQEDIEDEEDAETQRQRYNTESMAEEEERQNAIIHDDNEEIDDGY